jgi:hypothetical protein
LAASRRAVTSSGRSSMTGARSRGSADRDHDHPPSRHLGDEGQTHPRRSRDDDSLSRESLRRVANRISENAGTRAGDAGLGPLARRKPPPWHDHISFVHSSLESFTTADYVRNSLRDRTTHHVAHGLVDALETWHCTDRGSRRRPLVHREPDRCTERLQSCQSRQRCRPGATSEPAGAQR